MRAQWYIRCVLIRLCLLALLMVDCSAFADNIDGAAFVNLGWNKNPALRGATAAGLRIDAFMIPFPFHPRTQTFYAGISYDRVQGANGITIDFRARLPFFRCYGWEYHCEGKRFWLVAEPMIGKRWGGGGLSGFAGGQIQAVFEAPRDSCCRIGIGFQHRFPFNSPLHSDNAITLEIRVAIGFVDRPPPRPRQDRH